MTERHGMLASALLLVLDEHAKAQKKHPIFADDIRHGMNIVLEEALELLRAVNDGKSVEDVRQEAAHVAVTAIRLIESTEGRSEL